MTFPGLDAITNNPQYYEAILEEDGFYLVWKEDNEANKNWDKIFPFSDPIQYESPEESTGRTIEIDLSTINPDFEKIHQQEFKPSGYLIPSFRFLQTRLYLSSWYADDMDDFKDKFRDDVSEIKTLKKLADHRDILFQQIKRQAREVEYINQEITSVLKVYFYEAEQKINENRKNNEVDELNLLPEIQQFFRDAVLGGDTLNNVQSYWLPKVLEPFDYVSSALKEATVTGLITLSRKREPYLQIAEDLAKKILYLETEVERIITGKKLTKWDLVLRNMPSPTEVAKDFHKEANNIKYSVEVIAAVMQITKDYIGDLLKESELNDQSKIRNKISIRAIREKVNENGIEDPVNNTIRNWIKKYCEIAFPRTD